MDNGPIDDAIRGLASGFLIGIPVVFTVDSWWLGDQTGPMNALVLLVLALVLTLTAVYWIGFRRGRRRGWEYLADALEAVAMAILSLIVVFWALGQLGNGEAPSIVLGRISVAVGPVALGVAIANHLLPRDSSRSDPESGDAASMRHWNTRADRHQTLVEVGASLAGALFLCLSIVPSDDLSAISTEVPLRNLPWVILLSVVVSYCVVFAAGFAGERRRHGSPGFLQHPISETVIAYLAAFVVSLGMLWLFGRITIGSAPLEIFAKAVLLTFPASMAAAAGRLAI